MTAMLKNVKSKEGGSSSPLNFNFPTNMPTLPIPQAPGKPPVSFQKLLTWHQIISQILNTASRENQARFLLLAAHWWQRNIFSLWSSTCSVKLWNPFLHSAICWLWNTRTSLHWACLLPPTHSKWKCQHQARSKGTNADQILQRHHQSQQMAGKTGSEHHGKWATRFAFWTAQSARAAWGEFNSKSAKTNGQCHEVHQCSKAWSKQALKIDFQHAKCQKI